MIQGVEILRRKLSQRAGKPFANILNEKVIEAAIVKVQLKYRNRLFTPMVTIWAFLYQVLAPDKGIGQKKTSHSEFHLCSLQSLSNA